jgi:hypothetical protein
LELVAAAGDVGKQDTAVLLPCSAGDEQTPPMKEEESFECFPGRVGGKFVDE